MHPTPICPLQDNPHEKGLGVHFPIPQAAVNRSGQAVTGVASHHHLPGIEGEECEVTGMCAGDPVVGERSARGCLPVR
jgi:hypothetical protein